MDHATAMPKVEKTPPTLSLSEDDLPAIKGWKVGGKYSINLEVEQVSSSKGDMYGPMGSDKKISARFHVLSATTKGESKVEDESEEDESENETSSKEVVDAAKRTYGK